MHSNVIRGRLEDQVSMTTSQRVTPEILGTAIHMVLGDIPLPW